MNMTASPFLWRKNHRSLGHPRSSASHLQRTDENLVFLPQTELSLEAIITPLGFSNFLELWEPRREGRNSLYSLSRCIMSFQQTAGSPSATYMSSSTFLGSEDAIGSSWEGSQPSPHLVFALLWIPSPSGLDIGTHFSQMDSGDSEGAWGHKHCDLHPADTVWAPLACCSVPWWAPSCKDLGTVSGPMRNPMAMKNGALSRIIQVNSEASPSPVEPWGEPAAQMTPGFQPMKDLASKDPANLSPDFWPTGTVKLLMLFASSHYILG